jgi:plastocyanin
MADYKRIYTNTTSGTQKWYLYMLYLYDNSYLEIMRTILPETTQRGAFVIGLSVLVLLGLLSGYTMNRAASGQSAIQLSAKGATGSYTWIDTSTGAVNPTLNLKANTNQTIKIQNPTDTKHQLIIDQNGKQLATSGDIAPGSSGQVSFKPNAGGTFGYHCLYHPTMMKGTIQVQGTAAGGNPTVSNSTSSSSASPSTTSSPPTTGPKY